MVWGAELGSGCEGCGDAVALILGVTFGDRPTPALDVGMARHRRRVLLGAFGHREGGGRGVVPCTHGAVTALPLWSSVVEQGGGRSCAVGSVTKRPPPRQLSRKRPIVAALWTSAACSSRRGQPMTAGLRWGGAVEVLEVVGRFVRVNLRRDSVSTWLRELWIGSLGSSQ